MTRLTTQIAVLLLVLPFGIAAKTMKSTAAAPTPVKAKARRRVTPKKLVSSLKTHVRLYSAKASLHRRTNPQRNLHIVTYSKQTQEQALSFVSSRFASKPSDFENLQALNPFFTRLTAAQAENKPIHILQYGDSHTASDDWVDAMRKAFQERWGDGGPGFAIAGHPKGYRRFDLASANSAGWITEGGVGKTGDERNGLAGLSMTTNRVGETVSLTTSGDRLQLLFLIQPQGGSFTISCDGETIERVSTDGPLDTGVHDVPTRPGEHTYSVTTTSALPVRLFGWISEKNEGVTWETLGINGAQLRMLLSWDRDLWIRQLEARDPALVILAYGTNEALYPLFNPVTYRADLFAAVQLIHQAAPEAAILLIGPPDCDRRRPFPYLSDVIKIQREVARQTNCAFWDWAAHMNASGGRALWAEAGLSQTDLVHLTGKGYRMLGDVLAHELLAQAR